MLRREKRGAWGERQLWGSGCWLGEERAVQNGVSQQLEWGLGVLTEGGRLGRKRVVGNWDAVFKRDNVKVEYFGEVVGNG